MGQIRRIGVFAAMRRILRRIFSTKNGRRIRGHLLPVGLVFLAERRCRRCLSQAVPAEYAPVAVYRQVGTVALSDRRR